MKSDTKGYSSFAKTAKTSLVSHCVDLFTIVWAYKHVLKYACIAWIYWFVFPFKKCIFYIIDKFGSANSGKMYFE